MGMTPNEVPNLLKEWRNQAGFTQQQMADKLGMVRQSLGHYETGRTVCPLEIFLQWAEICGKSIGTETLQAFQQPPEMDVPEPARAAILTLVRQLPPSDSADVISQLRSMPPDLRRVMTNLLRLAPQLPEVLVEELIEQVDRWTDRYGDPVDGKPYVKKM